MRKQTRGQRLEKVNKAPVEVGILCFFDTSLCPSYYSCFSIEIYMCCSCSTFLEKIVFILLVICLLQLDLYTKATYMLLLYENSSPYILLYLVDELHYCCRWVTSMNHKLFVATLVYMHDSRHIVILWMILCEGSPPKNTCIIIDELVWGESPQDHLCYLWMMFTKWKEKYACFMSNSYTIHAITCYLMLPENFLQSVPLLWNVFKIVSVVETSCKFFCD